MNLLKENINKKLILIASPAGYGKTTLAVDYLRDIEIEYAWINISESIEHVYSFFYTIIHALRKLNSSFGEDSLNLLNSHLEKNKFNTKPKEAINDLCLTISRECEEFFINRTALVLDDYHHIEGIELKDHLTDNLVKKLPGNIQVIITSRQLPELDFLYYLENDMVLKIEMEDLIFNNSETTELLSRKYNVNNPGKVNEITEKLGGWVTGLHMISQGYGENIESAEIEEQPIPENIFNFLADKTFDRLDDETKELLMVTSVIENFHSDLCKALGVINFDILISKLLENHTFIQTIPITYSDGSVIISYNYLALFCNYMRSKLFASRSKDEVRELYRKTYRYYQKKDDTITAINYVIKAGDHEAAVKMINENYRDMFSEGKIEFLWTWLKAIPAGIIENNTESLLNLGVLEKFYAGDLNASLELLNKASEKARAEKEYKLLSRAAINRAAILQNLGNTAAAIDELTALADSKEMAEFRYNLLYYLAYALFHSSEYSKAEEILSRIEGITDNSIEVNLLYSARKLLGHINLIRGNYLKAVEYYEKAVANEKNVIDRFEVLCNLTLLSSQAAEYTKAEMYLEELEGMIKRFPTAILKIPYLLAKQAFLFETADYNGALDVLKNIYSESAALNHKQYIFLSSRLITEAYFHKNEFEQAREYYNISKQYLDANNRLKNVEVEVFHALLFDLSPEEKEKIFTEAYSYYKENSLLYNLAQVCYYISDFYFKHGRRIELEPYLKLSLELASANGYNSFLIREYKNDGSLLTYALNSPESEYDSTYLTNIVQKAS